MSIDIHAANQVSLNLNLIQDGVFAAFKSAQIKTHVLFTGDNES